ncbi:MAG: sigma-70 family RNA polymerase sigma factor [Prevotellaceae bacterium]|jgi:RNA polymerase sigma-70 factor (ECF subfamily)|nr:sigma-70 family RNA polymerase sigma factor [Prevotellaceae bacterium]
MEKKLLEADFLQMIQEYNRIIYKVTSFYADQNTTIDDLFQEVVLNLWKAFPNYRKESLVSTWIYRIALNTCVSYFRKNIRRPKCVAITPEIKVYAEDNEPITTLYACIDQLGKLERALILLWLEDRPHKEISDIMGITVTNVSTKINRIKEKIKQMSKT